MQTTPISDSQLSCLWKYGSATIEGYDVNQLDSNSKKILNLYEGFEIHFSLDSIGNVLSYTNYSDITKNLIIRMKSIPNTDSIQMVSTISIISKTFEDTISTINSYFPEIGLYFGSSSIEIKENETLKIENWVNPPFGKEQLKINGEYSISEITETFAKIKYQGNINQKELKTYLKNITTNSKLQFKTFNIQLDSNYTYNRKLQINTSVISRKKIQLDDTEKNNLLMVILL